MDLATMVHVSLVELSGRAWGLGPPFFIPGAGPDGHPHFLPSNLWATVRECVAR